MLSNVELEVAVLVRKKLFCWRRKNGKQKNSPIFFFKKSSKVQQCTQWKDTPVHHKAPCIYYLTDELSLIVAFLQIGMIICISHVNKRFRDASVTLTIIAAYAIATLKNDSAIFSDLNMDLPLLWFGIKAGSEVESARLITQCKRANYRSAPDIYRLYIWGIQYVSNVIKTQNAINFTNETLDTFRLFLLHMTNDGWIIYSMIAVTIIWNAIWYTTLVSCTSKPLKNGSECSAPHFFSNRVSIYYPRFFFAPLFFSYY